MIFLSTARIRHSKNNVSIIPVLLLLALYHPLPQKSQYGFHSMHLFSPVSLCGFLGPMGIVERFLPKDSFISFLVGGLWKCALIYFWVK